MSFSFAGVNCEMAFPSPVSACGCTPPPLCLRFEFDVPPPLPLLPEYPPDGALAVRGNGNTEGSSSTDNEFGLGTGTTVAGSDEPVEYEYPPYDDGGGEPPILFRSFRVMCERACESNVASIHTCESASIPETRI